MEKKDMRLHGHSVMIFLFVTICRITALTQTPSITIDFQTEPIGQISPSLLGVNNPMTQITERADFDTSTGQFPESFYHAMNIVNPGSMRFPGGNTSGLYHWENSLGPYNQRPTGLNGSTGNPNSTYYYFGFIEFMEFLDDIGASDPIICINFGTGTAQESSAWVEFCNAAVGSDPNEDGVDQALLRSQLGYPEPFGVQYWEIGNELGGSLTHMFSWHFGQQVNGTVDYLKTVQNYIYGGEQWQYRDLENAQGGQRVVREEDWSSQACKSSGEPDQIFYIKYPPADPDSFGLAVCTDDLWGETWQRVDNLSGHDGNDHVYTLDPVNGSIQFGDGTKGAVPPEGSSVRVMYKSVQQEGLIDFYSRMKMADPDIRIGVPFTDTTFHLQVVASDFDDPPFDFIVDHPYLGSQAQEIEIEHWKIHWYSDYLKTRILEYKNDLDTYYCGLKPMGVVITETNHVTGLGNRANESTNPLYRGKQLNYFGRSLENGLYVAGSFMSYLVNSKEARLWHLDHHSLIPDSDEPIAGWPCTSLMGPGPVSYINPSGLVYSLLCRAKGYNIIQTTDEHIPVYSIPFEDSNRAPYYPDTLHVPLLKTLAVENSAGDTAMVFVLNRASGLAGTDETYQNLQTLIHFHNAGRLSQITCFELNADSLWTINSALEPDNISIRTVNEQVFSDSFDYVFPPHSLTMIMLTQPVSGFASRSSTTEGYTLSPNYPNPFNATTEVDFNIPRFEKVSIILVDVLGRKQSVVLNKLLDAGDHSLELEMSEYPSGVYILHMKAGSFHANQKLILLK